MFEARKESNWNDNPLPDGGELTPAYGLMFSLSEKKKKSKFES